MSKQQFPIAVPELPVHNVAKAGTYYEKCLGFKWDWGMEEIGQVSRGGCRIFLTDNSFRNSNDIGTPVVIWINLDSKAEVDALYETWKSTGTRLVSKPESKPWNLHEFVAEDLDGNRFRIFYDFAWELPDRGGRKDDFEDIKQALGKT